MDGIMSLHTHTMRQLRTCYDGCKYISPELIVLNVGHLIRLDIHMYAVDDIIRTLKAKADI